MSAKQIAWKIIVHLAVIAGTLFPIFVSYDLHNAGDHPEKHLELNEVGVLNPLRDLSSLQEGAKVEVQVGDKIINNLSIIHATLQNTGKSPILPADFHENLSMEVSAPWEIVAVENDRQIGVKMKWTKMTKSRYEAAALLLNPGDITSFTIYLTNESLPLYAVLDDKSEPKLTWVTRIVNLQAIVHTGVNQSVKMPVERSSWNIFIHLSGWKLIFFMLVTLLNLAVLVYLLQKSCFLRSSALTKMISWIIGAAFLSMSVAECASTYLFGNSLASLANTGIFISSDMTNSEVDPEIRASSEVMRLWWLRAGGNTPRHPKTNESQT